MPRARLGRVTSKREPSESGLARVAQGPRGFIISHDGRMVARVGYSRGDLFARRPAEKPWYWSGGLDAGPRRNTANEGLYYATREEARDACVAWIKEQLAARAGKSAEAAS